MSGMRIIGVAEGIESPQDRSISQFASQHPVLKQALLEWRSQTHYRGLCLSLKPVEGPQTLDLAAVLKRKIKPAFAKLGVTQVGWHTFRLTVGTMPAVMGEHQLTIRDYLRHSNPHVTNKYLQAVAESKRQAQDKLVGAILPTGLLSASTSKTGPLMRKTAYWTLTDADRFWWVSCKPLKTMAGTAAETEGSCAGTAKRSVSTLHGKSSV